VARKKRSKPAPLQPTVNSFIDMWNSSLMLRLVEKTEEVLRVAAYGGNIWFSYYPPQWSHEWANSSVTFQVRVWLAPSLEVSLNPWVSFLICVCWKIRLVCEGRGPYLRYIIIQLSVESRLRGRGKILTMEHLPPFSEELRGRQLVSAFKAGRNEFERRFLEKASKYLENEVFSLLSRAQNYPHNWLITFQRFMDRFSKFDLDEGIYMKILPVGEKRWGGIMYTGGHQELRCIVTVRAPLFILAFSFFLIKPENTLPQVGMSLKLPRQFEMKVGVDTPHVEPTLMYTDETTLNAAIVSYPTQPLEVGTLTLDNPVVTVSKLNETLLNLVKPYLQQWQSSRQLLKSGEIYSSKKYALRALSNLLAFYAVVSGLLKSFGFDFAVEIEGGLKGEYNEDKEEFGFVAWARREFTFNCKKAGLVNEFKLKLGLEVIVGAQGDKWFCHSPLTVKLGLADEQALPPVQVSLSASDTIRVVSKFESNSKKLKNVLLLFARQARDFIGGISKTLT